MQLPAAATLEQATALLQELDAAIAAAGSAGLRLDAAALKEFDTSAVALLLHAKRLAAQSGVPFTVAGAPSKLRELAQLYGVEELLSLSDDVAQRSYTSLLVTWMTEMVCGAREEESTRQTAEMDRD